MTCSRLTNVDEEGRLFGVNGGSGGYAETVFRHAAKKLFGKEFPGPLDFRILRNADLQEVTLEVELISIYITRKFLFFLLFLLWLTFGSDVAGLAGGR